MGATRLPSEPQRAPVDGARFGVAYYRVSTTDQANTSYDDEGFSIQAQRDYCQRKAAELDVQLVDEYIDKGKSARTADRPGLQAMLARIKDDTDIQFVFVHKLDRLARNRQDDVQIELLFAKAGVRLVSCTENIDDSPSGKLVHGIMADIAEWYSANLSQEAKKGMRKKAENGGTPGNVPIGYENVRVKITELGKDIGDVRVHEVLGSVVTECFRRYDSGVYTLAELATYANEQGLRLRANRRLPERLITRQTMQRLLRNRYYVGWVRFGGVEYRGNHPPLIDQATFDRVQALLDARNSSKDKSQKRPHHLKGTLYCARCGRRLGITLARGRRRTGAYPYFFCLGRQVDKNSCPQGYIAVDEVVEAMRAYCSRVHLSDTRRRALRQAILADFAGKHDQGKGEIERQRRRLMEFEQRRRKAKTAYYADVLTLDELKSEVEAIRRGVSAAEAIIARWSVELSSITQSLDAALALMERPQVLYDALPEGLKSLFIRAVFDKVWIMDNQVVGTDLTPSFAELLTFEAQLALAEDRAAPAAAGSDNDQGEVTFHRRRAALAGPAGPSTAGRRRLHLERPRGTLAIDKQNPGDSRGRGSNMLHMVGATRLNLNPKLASFLRDHSTAELSRLAHLHAAARQRRVWRVRDRLTQLDVLRLVMARRTGMTTKAIAEHYGINVKSVRKLLREATWPSGVNGWHTVGQRRSCQLGCEYRPQ